jgi:formimidoylglutamate deiminase
MNHYRFEALLQDNRWLAPAYVGVDSQGALQYLSESSPEKVATIEVVNGIALPGFQNAHSHAFQFAMAGMAERHAVGANDDFWSWREAMYRCALNISPEQLEGIATMLYAEMLRKGFTHVAEFHYLHHEQGGKPYANLAEMGERLVAAANTAGIKITLIPILYQKGNFGKPPQPRQSRFISKTVDEYFRLLDESANIVSHYPDAQLGFGVHSLRAVDQADIITTFDQGPKKIPFHLHAAEQEKEVSDCVSYFNKRPITWLLENLPLDDRFHIVHCTHMNDSEVSDLASSGANVVLCPGTEGNLGDGIFRLAEFMKHGGNWSIGTDSHISLNPLEDLRWLDYTQRLTTHKRNTFADGAHTLIDKTFFSGSKAMGNGDYRSFFELGRSFDAVVFDTDSPLLLRPRLEDVLPALVYTADSSCISGTMVSGKWIVKNQRHLKADRFVTAFRRAMDTLWIHSTG